MIIKKWLKKNDACQQAVDWFDKQPDKSEKALLKGCIKDDHLDWANWVLARKLNTINRIKYAVYAARHVIHIFNDKFPEDKTLQIAIQAAENYIKNPTKKHKDAVCAAAYAAAYAAACAAAYAAAEAAACAVCAAADAAAYDAAYAAADAAAYVAAYAAADAAACAAAYAAADAASSDYHVDFTNIEKQKLMMKILRYGMKLLNSQCKLKKVNK